MHAGLDSAGEAAKTTQIVNREQLAPMNLQQKIALPKGLTLKGKMEPSYERALTVGALEFLALLHRNFETRRRGLMDRRAARQAQFDQGMLPDFLTETREIREG